MIRRICVVTGTRADYGILHWLLREIDDDPALQLQLVVTGMHLAPEFGDTYRAIEADGFTIAARVDTLLASNTAVGVCKSVGVGVIGFADVLANLRPHIVVVLGDRFEIFAAAQSALFLNIPIAHVHGGEVTEGAIDDAIRHALTKMATFHFVAAAPYAERVIRMGESPERVWTVGAPALDNIERLQLVPEGRVRADVGLPLDGPLFLVTYHPVTRSAEKPDDTVAALCAALDHFPDAAILITKANADTGGARINALFATYAEARGRSAVLVDSLGQLRYLSAVSASAVVIGNSSSGLVEAPALAVPTVNIGDRQRGRLRAASVIEADNTEAGIVHAIETGLSTDFRANLRPEDAAYGRPGASLAIKNILKTVPLEAAVMKRFYDGCAQ
jgi:UDP-N-acetylglucosamine 2-epimerase (non-hydrolysing)/GDP/UDP-N,N'-diacetylbacillosamine 2-epimerase (hydrolysing)